MGGLWRRVVLAEECDDCPQCGEPVCHVCNVHYSDCACPGPTQGDEYDYYQDIEGRLWATPKA